MPGLPGAPPAALLGLGPSGICQAGCGVGAPWGRGSASHCVQLCPSFWSRPLPKMGLVPGELREGVRKRFCPLKAWPLGGPLAPPQAEQQAGSLQGSCGARDHPPPCVDPVRGPSPSQALLGGPHTRDTRLAAGLGVAHTHHPTRAPQGHGGPLWAGPWEGWSPWSGGGLRGQPSTEGPQPLSAGFPAPHPPGCGAPSGLSLRQRTGDRDPPPPPHARHPQSQAVSLAHTSEDARLFSEASGRSRGFSLGLLPGLSSPSPGPAPAWPRSSVHVRLSELSVQGHGLPWTHRWGRRSLPSWLGWLLLSAQRVAWQPGEELEATWLRLDGARVAQRAADLGGPARPPGDTVQGRRVGVWGDLGRRLEAGGWAQAAVGRVLRRGLWGAWLALPVPLQPIPPHHAVAGPEGPPRGRSEGVLGHLAGWEAAPGPRLLPRHHATRGGGLSEPLWLQRPCPPGARLPEPPGWLRCRRGLPGRWGQTWALTRALCPLPGSRGVSGAPAAPGPCGRAREGPWPHWSEPEPTAVGSLALVGGLGAGTCQGAPPWRPVPSR